ncbi:Response regulator UvrY [Dyadobacter sp. CECT 9275]|uniref:Response regulator UvrY n=1 Tax=Dyadobacter helix TaxID=2822344 RepID=A0A916JDI6_9BACT|nr:response regulator transcription factor [Dyadobacter sp. CECT 9275]CAG4999040.1 Response regulator UvrY [Dyadobacter sp. CECT 9275]
MLNVLLVDDHSIVRSGLKLLLRDSFPSVKTDEASNGNIALKKITADHYDLIVLDITLPNTDALGLISRIITQRPDAKILLFSMVSDYASIKRYIKLGVKGYVNKNSEDDDILYAIKAVLNGKRYVSQEIMEAILDDKYFSGSDNPFDLLTEREFEIARRILAGDNLTTIAQTLNIHTSTVGTHKSKVFDKLKVSNIIELMELAKAHQLI